MEEKEEGKIESDPTAVPDNQNQSSPSSSASQRVDSKKEFVAPPLAPDEDAIIAASGPTTSPLPAKTRCSIRLQPFAVSLARFGCVNAYSRRGAIARKPRS
jgi:hypothetical protein